MVTALSLLLLIILITPSLYRALKGRFDVFEPITICVFMFALAYPLRALSIVYLEDLRLTLRPLGEPETIFYLTLALFYTIIGVIMFHFGYGARFGKALGQKLFITNNQWCPARTRRIIILFSISGLCFYLSLMEMAGGVIYFITHMAHRVELVAAAGGYVRWGVALMPLATIIWYIHYLTRKRRKLFWVHFAASSVVIASLGGRSELLLFWLVLLVIHHYIVKRVSFTKLFILGAVLFAFSSVILSFRLATLDGFHFDEFRMRVAESISWQGIAKISGGDFNIIDRFILIKRGVTVTDELDLLFGRTIFVDPLLMPIPRAIWPDKPTTLDGLIVRTFFPGWGGIGGIPPSLLGELYLNLLLPGIMLGMFVFGVACKILRSYLEFNHNNKGVIAVYAVSLMTFILGFALSGNFALGVISYLMQMIPLTFAILYVTQGKVSAGRSIVVEKGKRCAHEV